MRRIGFEIAHLTTDRPGNYRIYYFTFIGRQCRSRLFYVENLCCAVTVVFEQGLHIATAQCLRFHAPGISLSGLQRLVGKRIKVSGLLRAMGQ